MAYYNGFPATYQQLYQPYPVQQQQQSNIQGGRIWVQGIEGAKSYLVAPNSSVDLWDSENPVLYQKSADAAGMPSIKVLDYTVRDTAKNTANQQSFASNEDSPIYATKDEIKSVMEQITVLRKRLDRLIKKQEDAENE